MKDSTTNATGEVSKELITQLTQTAKASAEAVKSGLNEVAAVVQDDKFLKGLGLGVVLGVVGYYLTDTYGGHVWHVSGIRSNEGSPRNHFRNSPWGF